MRSRTATANSSTRPPSGGASRGVRRWASGSSSMRSAAPTESDEVIDDATHRPQRQRLQTVEDRQQEHRQTDGRVKNQEEGPGIGTHPRPTSQRLTRTVRNAEFPMPPDPPVPDPRPPGPDPAP